MFKRDIRMGDKLRLFTLSWVLVFACATLLPYYSFAASASYTYDANGNMTSDGTLNYEYDYGNRLIKVIDAATQAVKAEYVYDGLGRRVKKTVDGITTYFIYDINGNLISEYDGSGNWKSDYVNLPDGEPLARMDAGVQNPPNPSASPYETSACLTWVTVAGASYYIVCRSDISGYWPNCSPAITESSYCVDGLASGIKYFFVVKAYDSGGNIIGQSDEASATPEPGNPSLSHSNYSPTIGGQSDCSVCHVQPGTFMQGFGVRTSVGLCFSCHSASGVGHDRPYSTGHPIYVNVTSDANHKLPTLGSVTGMSSDKINYHLYSGKKVVCMTCHNSMVKPNDPGRSWEQTYASDRKTYFLLNGGWNYNAYLKPVVYKDTSLWLGPTYLKDRKNYIVPENEYDIYPGQGSVVFHVEQLAGTYIYVTLGNDYLRNTNVNNQLCLDCHITSTHKGADCTICHGTHNTGNLCNIREKIGSPGGYKEVEYRNISAMSGNRGVCVVCHTTTMYHNITAISPTQHYDNNNCTACHPHRKGFPSFTTVLNTLTRTLYAFFGEGVAYAAPPAWSGQNPTELPPGLQNHSLPSQAWENGLKRFKILRVELVKKPKAVEQSATAIKDDIIYYYHNDHLGTPLYMTDETGSIVWRREQTPFGVETCQRGMIIENHRMPGQYWDAEKNSSYNFRRDNYFPYLGRYGQPDPIGQAGGINPYPYANNNPVNVSDPNGQNPVVPALVGLGLVGLGWFNYYYWTTKGAPNIANKNWENQCGWCHQPANGKPNACAPPNPDYKSPDIPPVPKPAGGPKFPVINPIIPASPVPGGSR